MNRKKCPLCSTEVAPKCRSCPECGNLFKDAKNKKTRLLFSNSYTDFEKLIYSLNDKIDELLESPVLKSKPMDPQTEKYLKRIDEKLSSLLSSSKKRTWVKVGIIQDLTGWDREGLRKARRNNIVESRQTETGIEYLLESVPEIFITNKNLNVSFSNVLPHPKI